VAAELSEETQTLLRRARLAARHLATSPAQRRLAAVAAMGADLTVDRDPLGVVIDGWTDLRGVRYRKVTAPIGVLAVDAPDTGLVADAVLAGNVVLATGYDPDRAQTALRTEGLPEDSVLVCDRLPTVEVDAVVGPHREVVLAERTSSHRHVYVDPTANEYQANYIVVNAAVYGAADTVVFHDDFSRYEVSEIQRAVANQEASIRMVGARTFGEAVDFVERRSGGLIETILTTDIRIAHDFTQRVDATAIVLNCSPAVVDAALLQPVVRGLTRVRLIVEGEGQVKQDSR
jgi:hypothetical protein